MQWIEAKTWLVELTGMSKDAMHAVLAVYLMLLVALLIRRSLAHPVPLLAVMLAEAVNEWNDLGLSGGWSGANDYTRFDTTKDIIVTLAIPITLFLLTRFVPGIFVRKEEGKSSHAENGSN